LLFGNDGHVAQTLVVGVRLRLRLSQIQNHQQVPA